MPRGRACDRKLPAWGGHEDGETDRNRGRPNNEEWQRSHPAETGMEETRRVGGVSHHLQRVACDELPPDALADLDPSLLVVNSNMGVVAGHGPPSPALTSSLLRFAMTPDSRGDVREWCSLRKKPTMPAAKTTPPSAVKTRPIICSGSTRTLPPRKPIPDRPRVTARPRGRAFGNVYRGQLPE